ncbi:MAG TPA: N-acetylmuramoyl-L-alanine amidase [Eoetvoesiella sp.]
MKLPRLFRPKLRRLAGLLPTVSLVLLLAACSSYSPDQLKIDRSIQAKSQDSRVEFIVLHYTSTGNHASLKILSEQNVSSHYLITDDARPHVYQLVDESRRAWHAGVSQWYGRTDMNAGSIGIELVNQGGSKQNWAPYSPTQIRTLIALLHDVIKRHQIKPYNIVGHSDIAPQRKVDPGPLFPWKKLADAGIGRWYKQTKVDEFLLEFQRTGLPDILAVQTELERLGYAVPKNGLLDKATRNVIAAFQMHYRPARYDGVPDAQTAAILKALR